MNVLKCLGPAMITVMAGAVFYLAVFVASIAQSI